MTRAPEQHVVSGDRLPRQRPDVDPAEAQDWRESLDGVIDHAGPRGAGRLTLSVRQRARERQVGVPGPRSTDHVDTIPPAFEPTVPGDTQVQRRVRASIWRNLSRGKTI
jgi:pyruvate dehydrogenase E1 component